MRRPAQSAIAMALSVLVPISCAEPAPSRPGDSARGSSAAPAAPSRTLVMVARDELLGLQPKLLGNINRSRTARRLFSAYLAGADEGGVARPYLVAALPPLGSDSWRVFDDGRMETTYTLRPGLTWHDGARLTSDDFVISSGCRRRSSQRWNDPSATASWCR